MGGPRRRAEPSGTWAELGQVLAQRRRQLDLTQSEVADLSGLSARAVQAIESGRVAPRVTALVQITHALGLDVVILPHHHDTALPPGSVALSLAQRASGSEPGRS
jgi:transcriptional regulator with XRE-family HTH domain